MSSEPSKNLCQQVQQASQCLRKYLDTLPNKRFRSHSSDPVRTKNLEKVAGYLQSILVYLDSQADKSLATDKRAQSLSALLEQIKNPATLSSNNAWELADLFDAELLWFSEDTYLYTQLKCLEGSIDSDAVKQNFCFPTAYLQHLTTDSYEDGIFAESHRLEVIYLLYHLKQTQIGEYRRDRAKVGLRGNYLARMAALLGLLLVGLGFFYISSTHQRDPLPTKYLVYMLFLMVFSGATGSVLSHAFKLGKQPLRIGDPKTTEPPLGIRALLSDWKVFLAQPVIGAATAVVIFLVISSGLLQVGGKELGPSGLALIGFLTGFSEPFFIGTLDRIAGGVSTPMS